jgi:hypothetical protein
VKRPVQVLQQLINIFSARCIAARRLAFSLARDSAHALNIEWPRMNTDEHRSKLTKTLGDLGGSKSQVLTVGSIASRGSEITESTPRGASAVNDSTIDDGCLSGHIV